MMHDSKFLQRRRLLAVGLGAVAVAALGNSRRLIAADTDGAAPEFLPLDKPKSFWKDRLPEERYAILFEEKTERAFTSPLDKESREGLFICAACKLPLFDSNAKYDSGTGWPSFFKPLDAKVVGKKRDFLLFYPRTEYHCARCGGHQGHVFDDGPRPTGQRWCNNGLALEFVPKGDALPPLVS